MAEGPMYIDIRIGKSRLIREAACLRGDGPWQFLVWSDQKTLLPFMVQDTAVSPVYDKIDEVVVNQTSCEEVSSFDGLFPGSFFQDGTGCYFIPPGYKPPWVSPAGVRGTLSVGLTTGKSYIRDTALYRGGLDYYPVVKEYADNIEAARMKFNSGSVALDNTDGSFDDAYSFFGNSLKVYIRDEGYVLPLYEYYIKDISISLSSVTFGLGDKRQRLSQKIPPGKFTAEEYPYMSNPGNTEQKSKHLGKVIPLAYGYCMNVPAICVDEFKIYAEGTSGALKPDRTFKVCQRIISIDSVMVKMTQPSGSSGSQEVWTEQKGNIKSIDNANGLFTMNRQYCMPEISGAETIPEMFEVMVTGVFGLPESDCTPGKILAEIMSVYGGVSFGPSHYNVDEFNAELAPLAKIGLYLDKEQDIFNVIETLQNGSDYSFQFMTDFDKFSAKRNDNERAVKTRIAQNDILNLSETKLTANTGEYATIVDIGYNTNHRDDSNERLIDKKNRDAILYLYKIEKAYRANTLLRTKNEADGKASRLAEYFSEPRPEISGITLFGRKWFDLKCYDIVDIDLRRNEPIESYGNSVIGRAEKIRPFIGRIKGKITSVEKNTRNETVKISVVKLEDIPV
jgi:hypothetical protein